MQERSSEFQPFYGTASFNGTTPHEDRPQAITRKRSFEQIPLSEKGHNLTLDGSVVRKGSPDSQLLYQKSPLSVMSTSASPRPAVGRTSSLDSATLASRLSPTQNSMELPYPYPFHQERRMSTSDSSVDDDLQTEHLNDPSLLERTLQYAREKPTVKEKHVSLGDLVRYFSIPLDKAARQLGVCPTTLKKLCRQYGIQRWPCRKLRREAKSRQAGGSGHSSEMYDLDGVFNSDSPAAQHIAKFKGNGNNSLLVRDLSLVRRPSVPEALSSLDQLNLPQTSPLSLSAPSTPLSVSPTPSPLPFPIRWDFQQEDESSNDINLLSFIEDTGPSPSSLLPQRPLGLGHLSSSESCANSLLSGGTGIYPSVYSGASSPEESVYSQAKRSRNPSPSLSRNPSPVPEEFVVEALYEGGSFVFSTRFGQSFADLKSLLRHLLYVDASEEGDIAVKYKDEDSDWVWMVRENDYQLCQQLGKEYMDNKMYLSVGWLRSPLPPPTVPSPGFPDSSNIQNLLPITISGADSS